jgi:translation elongation factor EF-1alpha
MSEKAMKICFSIIGVVVLFTIIVGVITREKEPSLEEKVSLGAILHDGSKNNYFTSPEGRYALKITSVYETEPDTTDENAPKTDRVVVVIYEYSNDDIEAGLIITPAHFKAYDKSGNELEVFPQENLFEPGEISTLGTHTASVAFAIGNLADNYIEVDYYNDLASKTPDLVYEGIWE